MGSQAYIPDFPHRRNRDGTYDSICRRCAATVATAATEADLLAHEITHKCPGSWLREAVTRTSAGKRIN
jgi:ribosomal protein L40E